MNEIIMTKKEKRKYQVWEEDCYNRECFIPFSGNGIKICRLYELGRCPENRTNNYKDCKGGTK